MKKYMAYDLALTSVFSFPIVLGIVAGCTAQEAAKVQGNISTVSSDILTGIQAGCTDAGPILMAVQTVAPLTKVGVVAGMLSGACTATGTVVPSLVADATTPVWIGATTQLLKSLATPSSVISAPGTVPVVPPVPPNSVISAPGVVK